ncbi:hypothetical protein BDZ91DRAFT_757658 [Kalaharituber pfeilii]|nr:hypothetical protein BDZ91DRAFT_757658 [Kalaharituber pfeilii]
MPTPYNTTNPLLALPLLYIAWAKSHIDPQLEAYRICLRNRGITDHRLGAGQPSSIIQLPKELTSGPQFCTQYVAKLTKRLTVTLNADILQGLRRGLQFGGGCNSAGELQFSGRFNSAGELQFGGGCSSEVAALQRLRFRRR